MDIQESLLRLLRPLGLQRAEALAGALAREAGASRGLHDSQVLARAHALSVAPVEGRLGDLVWQVRQRKHDDAPQVDLRWGLHRLGFDAHTRASTRDLHLGREGGWVVHGRARLALPRHGDGGGGGAGSAVGCKPVAGERTVASLARGGVPSGPRSSTAGLHRHGRGRPAARCQRQHATASCGPVWSRLAGHPAGPSRRRRGGPQRPRVGAAPPRRASHARPGLPPPDGPRRQS
ncbi:hypothetical protein G6F31_016271 [Rhizopus arrhizus]|nr:hypothetical protein G6F31_016271 [Rhizopus arrhizus]